MIRFDDCAIDLGEVLPLLDGEVPEHRRLENPGGIAWRLASGATITLTVTASGDVHGLDVAIQDATEPPLSLGLRFAAVHGVERYMRNGYHSWDGSMFAAPGAEPATGHAMTALLPPERGVVVLGYDRHDRFQTRFRFGGEPGALQLDCETLLDRTGATAAETLLVFAGEAVEPALRRWSGFVAARSPLPPRVPERRITGWCSWYNHYAMIDEAAIRREIAGCAAFRRSRRVPLDVFLIDDGFTPEMGDWLEVKPQFPGGIAPLLAEAAAAGFIPGLWIAPFMVGNRSRLYAGHPDWVVQDIAGGPLVQMRFYGEFRWHKRSEEYYILDITHPDAAAYIAEVFRTWARDWGARYFKTDFMLFGSEHGPDRAAWHEPRLSRIAVWRRMATLIREAIGEDRLWLGCGCPLWAGVGLVDAVRIGRDVGTTWAGEQSAESLLRDLATRNHANGVLWQADPDCLLLRERFHELGETQVESLARYAAASGGVLMTSDTLSELPPARAALFAELLSATPEVCRFPRLGREPDGLIEYELGGTRFAFNLTPSPRRVGDVSIPPFATERL